MQNGNASFVAPPFPPAPAPILSHAQTSCQASWQAATSPHDAQQLRSLLTNEIINVFSRKRGTSAQTWGPKIHEFVRKLEQELWRRARSQEEYLDLSTLETRLKTVATLMNEHTRSNAGQQAYSNSSVAAPPPAVPSTTSGNPSLLPNSTNSQQAGMFSSGMMPAPGGPATSGILPSPPASSSLVLPSPSNASQPQRPSTPYGLPDTSSASLPKASSSGLPTVSSGLPTSLPVEGGLLGGGPPSVTNPYSTTLTPSGAPVLLKRSNGVRDSSFGASGLNGVSSSSHRMTSLNGPGGMIPSDNGVHGLSPGMSRGGTPGGFAPTSTMVPTQSISGMVPVDTKMPSHQPNLMNMPPVPGPLNPGTLDNMSVENASPQFIQRQQRWLLFLRHCAKCRAPESECQLQQQCRFGKQLWTHILGCSNPQCEYPRCSTSKELLKHHQKCSSQTCPICHPVKEYVRKTRQKQQQELEDQQRQQQQQQQQQQPQPPFNSMHPGMMHAMHPPAMLQPPNSTMNGPMPMVPMPPPPSNFGLQPPLPPQPPQPPQQHKRSHASMMGMSSMPTQGMIKHEGGATSMPLQSPSSLPYAPPPHLPPQPQPPYSTWEEPVKRIKTDSDPIISKNTGTSLLETFTYEQIVNHKELIYSAQQQQRNAQIPPASPADACKVCGCVKLLYEPNALYCSMCGLKIKRGQTYYTTPPDQGTEVRGNWCHPCYMEVKQERIPTSFGGDARKSDLIKKKNDEEIEEPWVQCDCCEMWVHQVSSRGLMVRPQAMLEAKDLPQCELSKYLEHRIWTGLQKEREARAAKEGKEPHEVITAENLTVRVVNSIIKKAETKPKFYETFSPEGFPSEFPYRQRVVLLFQKLDGVDVCIFCMYVQEYGADCPEPNRNCVYLSYLDSVKYFRPDMIAVQPQREPGPHPNIALRTYVYHQMLIGYLSFVKMLGFEQMYIWACPPMQGDDYILYCHPNKQKTPRSDRLRNWYLDMLRLAKYEGVVLHLSTLWDTYFPGGKDHRMERCSATHIPYLQGDYWPGEAENLLTMMAEGCRQAGKNHVKSGGNAVTARKLGKGKRYGGGGPESIDEQLMEKLGEILGGNMKDDFIVVHLQEVCTFCRRHIRSNTPIYRYKAAGQMRAPAERKFEGIKLESGPNVPNAPGSSLSICEACYYDEESRHAGGLKPRLPAGVTPKLLQREVVRDVPVCMDPSQDVENEYFETRESFLNLCQSNHYQFDTLRRAKHSSMMVLYHTHNPHAPAFASSCNLCHIDMEPGSGWHCNQCNDFDICTNCKNTRGHQHPLVPQSNRNYDETRMRLTDAERRERSEQLQKTMALLVHACSCNDVQCQSSSCRKEEKRRHQYQAMLRTQQQLQAKGQLEKYFSFMQALRTLRRKRPLQNKALLMKSTAHLLKTVPQAGRKAQKGNVCRALQRRCNKRKQST
ncbi:histone acetylation protein-domain-containing protein [Dunaliella salina]|uniref:histone acetyltransferase n=1 Tax=Dunaliella salina TaxID=3046 RepID=A0ABQ7G8U6_DUNSA|nr:histone acetylation protein-domain-containing protein [Dunaliella salina]|eukprot:KAF5831026.1 histone acetylation protein-domain-containing protein [Dunaliella salina]